MLHSSLRRGRDGRADASRSGSKIPWHAKVKCLSSHWKWKTRILQISSQIRCSTLLWVSILTEVKYTAEYWSQTMWLSPPPTPPRARLPHPYLLTSIGPCEASWTRTTTVANQTSAAEEPSHLAPITLIGMPLSVISSHLCLDWMCERGQGPQFSKRRLASVAHISEIRLKTLMRPRLKHHLLLNNYFFAAAGEGNSRLQREK